MVYNKPVATKIFIVSRRIVELGIINFDVFNIIYVKYNLGYFSSVAFPLY